MTADRWIDLSSRNPSPAEREARQAFLSKVRQRAGLPANWRPKSALTASARPEVAEPERGPFADTFDAALAVAVAKWREELREELERDAAARADQALTEALDARVRKHSND